MEINSKSQVVKMADIDNKTNYVPEGNPGWLIRIGNIDNKKLTPIKMSVEKNLLNLFFEGDIELQVLVNEKDDYIRFELIKATNTNEINNIFWGPFNTTIDETIGEVVGVVRNKDFAIGMQSLNAKTVGGKLQNEEGATSPGATIGGSAATKEDFGSAIQAFCINHALDRIIKVWHHHENCPVAGLSNYSIEGSAISIFGTTPGNALLTIGKISQAEELPYQVIDGEWIRTSGITGRPYLITQFTEENFDEILELTERLGFYSIYHEHPFENWGHFDLLKSQFPNGRAGMKACVDKAKDKNIRVGVHTLTNFITTNDPFVTTDLNSGLMAAGIALLEQDIDENTTEILVDNYDYFAQTSTLNSVLIGNEIIRYQEVTKEKPYTLVNCVRGAYNTKATAHKKGTKAKKLMDFPYRTLFPDWDMQNKLIQNLADFFNETGVSHMDFDGHEGTYYTGQGDYALNYFAEEFLKRVNHTVINGSSIITHFYWHNNSYINWGEPWYASFRESQSEHRFRLQPFLERNYMPNMLGWFLVTPDTFVEDIEWMMAVAAGYNAGYALVVRYNAYRNNPDIDKIIETIVLWEEAKRLGIFSEEQLTRLRDPDNDFHLKKADNNEWILQNFDKFRFEHQRKTLQPGEPVYTKWQFENNSETQDIHLHLMVTGNEVVVENIELEIDNFFTVIIPVLLQTGQSLVWDGSEQMKLYSDRGRFIKSIDIQRTLPALKKGKHTINIQAKNMTGEEPVIKGVVRLKGEVETIIK